LTNGGQLGAQLAAEQTLYDGGQRSFKARQAEFDMARSQYERKLAELDLRLEATQAFTDVLRLQADLALKHLNQIRLRDYLGLVQRMHTGGQVGFTDVLKTRIQVSEAESDAKQTEADLQAAKFSLLELLGAALDGNLQVKGSLDSVEPPAPLDTLGNADWEVARLGMRSAELDVQAAQGEWKPTVALAADAGLLTSVENLQQASKDRANMLGASVGLHVDVPVFGWGLREIHLRQRRLAADSLKWQWLSQRRNLLTEHRKAWLQWDAAQGHRDALRANLSAAADNYSLTKSKYAGGQGLASEVLDAEKLWVDTQASLIQAQADLRILGAKLKRLEAH
jgi:outer membrane protein TolC